MNHYPRFGVMIATSTVVMLGLMYLNTYQLDHVFFSETRAYMALVMGATMAVIMLGVMLGMFTNRRANIGIAAGSAGRLCGRALARPQPGDGRRRVLHEGHDPASLHRDPDQRTGAHRRSACPGVG